MNIILSDGQSYSTDVKSELRNLKRRVATLQRNDNQADLRLIQQQIKAEPLLTEVDVDLYDRIAGERTDRFVFDYTHFDGGDDEGEAQFYTFDGEGFFCLPDGDNKAAVLQALLAKILYDLRRPGRRLDRQPCLTTRKLIEKLEPKLKGAKEPQLTVKLHHLRSQSNTYVGEYPSSESDSEAEADYQAQTAVEKAAAAQRAAACQTRGELSRYRFQFNKAANGKPIKPVPPKLAVREEIHHRAHVRANARQDLSSLNRAIREGGDVSAVIAGLGTSFVVAQYRGVHYDTRQWNKASRGQHREMDEVGLPQYSLSVIKAAGYINFDDYLEAREDEPDIDERLTALAKRLQEKLSALRETGAVCYKGYTYSSRAHMLQHLYTSDYAAFHAYIKREYRGGLRRYLLTADNPFVSTGDIPRHALLYAYGLKAYAGQEGKLLTPNYRETGQPERPYSGKVWVSLHPVTDFIGKHAPMHLPQLFWQGDTIATPIIVSERENCFPAMIPADRVIFQYKAKYPSFVGDVTKGIYPEKYGLNRKEVDLYRQAFARARLGSDERVLLEKALGESLCAYHEARLIEIARTRAAENDQVLIYRQNDGTFGFDIPKTVPTNIERDKWAVINSERGVRRRVSGGASDFVNPGDALGEMTRNMGSPQRASRALTNLFRQPLARRDAMHGELKRTIARTP